MARSGRGRRSLTCSFCGKGQQQVQRLIAGPGVLICDECIALCNEILTNEPAPLPSASQDAAALDSPRRMTAPWWLRLIEKWGIHRVTTQESSTIYPTCA